MTWTPPKKWTEVYPYGTTVGDEEHKFFVALARSNFQFRSIASIAKQTKLSEERVIEIVEKYNKLGIVVQSEKNPDNWAYWERAPKLARTLQEKNNISSSDLKKRISNAINP